MTDTRREGEMRLSDHCHAATGFGYVPPWTVNAGFVCGSARTSIVDTGPTALAAATILGYAQAARPGNQLLAIDTELHLDHIAGNAVMRDAGIDVWGHPSIRRSDQEYAADVEEFCACVPDPARRADGEGRLPFLDTRIVNPNRAVDHEQELDLGGVTAAILLLPGHTRANLAVWVARDRVLFTGDTIVSGYRPNLASGGPPEWRLWLAALARVEGLEPAVVVPGHGRVLRGLEIRREVARIRDGLLSALGERSRA